MQVPTETDQLSSLELEPNVSEDLLGGAWPDGCGLLRLGQDPGSMGRRMGGCDFAGGDSGQGSISHETGAAGDQRMGTRR